MKKYTNIMVRSQEDNLLKDTFSYSVPDIQNRFQKLTVGSSKPLNDLAKAFYNWDQKQEKKWRKKAKTSI